MPPTPLALTCDRRVGGRGSTLLTRVLGCRFKEAQAAANGATFDEAGCERKQRTFYDNYNIRFLVKTHCPLCLITNEPALRDIYNVSSYLNNFVYCDQTGGGSPSGAFIDSFAGF